MKISSLLLCSLCLTVCSCDRAPSPSNGTAESGSKLVSTEAARQIGMHVLLNRYPKAEIISEQSAGQNYIYRFATNGVTVPLKVVVDRKAGQARFEK